VSRARVVRAKSSARWLIAMSPPKMLSIPASRPSLPQQLRTGVVWNMKMIAFFSWLSLSAYVRIALADMYLHNPRGSNNKLSEESNNVQNDNRLFDSQNNAAAGYQVGDACERACDADPDNENHQYDPTVPGAMEGMMQYYRGSELWIEWTQQHGCGSDLGAERQPNVVCTVILQYMCDSDNALLGRTLNGNGRSGDTSRGAIRDGYLRGNQN
ncbi:unnamed protein product, partial [Amoebophrya sp. A120]